MPSFGGEVK